jgi:hypothetical protein
MSTIIISSMLLLGCGGSETTGNSSDSTVDEEPTTATDESTTTTEESTTTTEASTTTTSLPLTYEALSDRDWKLLVKNPDSKRGSGVMVYGTIFQFDANTGPTTFLANGFASKAVRNSYGGDIIRIDGSESDLANLLEDDKFICECVVMGAYSYDTKAGGSNTAIWFFAKSVIPG